MIRSAVTVSLVPEARGGPFVFWGDLPGACARAAALRFDGIEIFAPSADALDPANLRSLLDRHGLKLAALGTGAGWLLKKLTLTNPDAGEREKAMDFIRRIIDVAGPLGGATIVGSMQGRWGDSIERQSALVCLADALHELGNHAEQYGTPVLFEPLNRYETNLVTNVRAGIELVGAAGENTKLLCDLFHMNIEEENVAEALKLAGAKLGHIHLVDSNRRPAGCGHTDFGPIAAVLRSMRYDGYASAEALAYPTPDEAASLTMKAYRRWLAGAVTSSPAAGAAPAATTAPSTKV